MKVSHITIKASELGNDWRASTHVHRKNTEEWVREAETILAAFPAAEKDPRTQEKLVYVIYETSNGDRKIGVFYQDQLSSELESLSRLALEMSKALVEAAVKNMCHFGA